MPDIPFDIGDRVIDREEHPATPSVVVALPETLASEWVTYGGTTVAQANPEYPADAPIVLVVDAADVETYLSEWDGETPLSQPALDETGVYYEAVPAPRFTTPEPDEDATDDGAGETDTASSSTTNDR